MPSTFWAETFTVVTDEDLRQLLAEAFAPEPEPDEESQGWLFKSRHTCKFYQTEEGVQMEICTAHTQVTDSKWQSANYDTVGLAFDGPLGREIVQWLCGGTPVTEPEGLRARPTPSARHDEDAPIVGRVIATLRGVAKRQAS